MGTEAGAAATGAEDAVLLDTALLGTGLLDAVLLGAELLDTELVGAELLDTELVGMELPDTELLGTELASVPPQPASATRHATRMSSRKGFNFGRCVNIWTCLMNDDSPLRTRRNQILRASPGLPQSVAFHAHCALAHIGKCRGTSTMKGEYE